MPLLIVAWVSVIFFVFNGFLNLGAPFLAIPAKTLALFVLLELSIVVSICWFSLTIFQRHLRPLAILMVLVAPPLVALLYTAQAYSIYLTNDYISVIALQNTTELRYIVNWFLLAGMIAVPVLWWSMVFLLVKCQAPLTPPHAKKPPHRLRYSAIALGILAGSALWVMQASSHWSAPLPSLIDTTYAAFSAPKIVDKMSGLNDDYPFMRQGLGVSSLDFQRKSLAVDQPNVIIIFAEGLSARIMSSYGGIYPELTPALDRFASRSLQVKNFYNHTAATFRGLRGILSSGYPYFGGAADWANDSNGEANPEAKVKYRTLPGILKEHGYKTVFLSPHSNSNPLNSMLRALDFDHVYAFDDYSSIINIPPRAHPAVSGAGTDQTVFEVACQLLTDHEAASHNAPLFFSLYNIGTHAFIDSPPIWLGKETRRYGQGNNPALNRFHEFDRVWDQFLSCFDAADLGRNTMLILTSDHAMFHEQPVLKAFDEDPTYQGYFVDQIPLLIHAPQWSLPATWDAHNTTTLDLAPTVLHLLDKLDDCHAFLGQSIFTAERSPAISMAAQGEKFHYIGDWGVTSQIPEEYREAFAAETQRIRTYYSLERSTRLFNRDQCIQQN